MTEPGGDPDRESDGVGEEEPARFKDDRVRADDHDVDDTSAAAPRMTWNSVTDTGGTRQSADGARSESGFHFDLGGALARLSGDAPEESSPPPEPETLSSEDVRAPAPEPSEPAVDPLAPVRGLVADEPIDEDLPRRVANPVAPPDDALPEIREATSPTDPIRPYSTARRSVFDDTERNAAPAPAPSLPSEPRLPGAASSAPTLPSKPPPAAPTPAAPSPAAAAPAAPASGEPGIPTVQSGLVPTLPPVAPAAPSPVAAPVENAPTNTDIHALRSAQLRASRQERKGRLFGRTLLAFLLIGGLIAISLVFGRAYLFPTEWDASLTPIVDEIQQERGAEFESTVPLVVQPAEEYAATVLGLTIGSEWVDRVPEWRAAGLATGDPTTASIAASLTAGQPVVYDAEGDTIYQLADADPSTVEPGLRLALETAFDRQARSDEDGGVVTTGGVGFTGVSSRQDITRRAVDRFLAGSGEVTADSAEAVDLPLPIAYELAAVDRLGEAILVSSGVSPANLTVGRYPDSIYGALNDDPVNTAAGPLLPGDRSLADPVALGTDDWSLVWAARLPSSTVDRLVEAVRADSYRPIERADTRCFVAVFQTSDEEGGALLLSSLGQWVAAAPADSGAAAVALAPTRIQLEACDPGPGAAVSPDPTSVDALIARQLGRLTP